MIKTKMKSHTFGNRFKTALTQSNNYKISKINLENSRLEISMVGGTRPMMIVIDNENKIIEHSGCPDFEHRCISEKKLCKHLLIIFSRDLHASFTRLILDNIQEYEFTHVISSILHPNSMDSIDMNSYLYGIKRYSRARPNKLHTINTGYIDGDEHNLFKIYDYIPADLPQVKIIEQKDNIEAEINRVIKEMEDRGELSDSPRIRRLQENNIKGQVRKQVRGEK